MITRTLMLALVGALVLPSTMAVADIWLPASTTVYLSPNDSVRFTVKPAEYQEDNRTPCHGQMERLREDGKWSLLWERDLLNSYAPLDVYVSDSGNVATSDNHGSIGQGDDVVVIYDQEGGLVRKFALADLLSEKHIKGLEHAMRSIHWRLYQGTQMDSKELMIRVHNPGVPLGDFSHYSVLRIRLSDGRVTQAAHEE